MSIAAAFTPEAGSPRAVVPTSRSAGSLRLVEDACRDCGRALAAFEEHRCADCEDLALHAACRDCGRILADSDLDAGACASCDG